MKEEGIKLEGVISDVYPNSIFEVTTDKNHKLTCTISGKLRMNSIRILKGDRVDVEVSPYDLTKGRIIWRHK